jgi:hypothetical protein
MEELAAERVAVGDALEREGMSPWTFELDAGARSESARETYLRELAVSDVYVGIFWKGYGAYTTDEFDAAGSAEVPRLVYEKTVQGSLRDPKLQAFLEEAGHVERGVTIRRFETSDELATMVVEDIGRLRSELQRIWTTRGRAYTYSRSGSRLDRVARMTPMRRTARQASDCPMHPVPFFDRVDEVARARGAIIAGERLVGFEGEPGIGKTAAMRALAHDAAWTSDRFPDGVGLCVPSLDSHAIDLQRTLWTMFYRVADRAYIPGDGELRRDLVTKRALIFLDDVRLATDQLEQLNSLMPECALVVTPSWGIGGRSTLSGVKAVQLSGFDDASHTVGLFSAVYRQSIPPAAEELVARLAVEVGGSPGKITSLANQAWGSGVSLGTWLDERRHENGDTFADTVAARADTNLRRLIAVLAAFGADVATPEGVMQRLGVPPAALRASVDAGDAEDDGGRYRLSGAVFDVAKTIGDPASMRGQIFEATVDWVTAASREDIDANRVFLQLVYEWGTEDDRRRGALVLARALSRSLALSGAWAAWGSTLDAAVSSAEVEHDTASTAWALHERGTRALMLGVRRDGSRDLKAARSLYTRLGDVGAAELSRHNLTEGLAALGVGAGTIVAWVIAALVVVAALVGGVAATCAFTDLCGPPSGPALDVAPGSVDFGEIAAGAGTGVEPVTITNRGEEALTLGSVNVSGDAAFELTRSDCPDVLEPGFACSYTVSFSPVEVGGHAAALEISLEGADALLVPLSGVGKDVESAVEVSPPAVEFEQVAVGSGSRAEEVAVANRGDAPATIGAAALQGDDVFSISGSDCPQVLGSQSECSFTITFAPAAPGAYTATFELELEGTAPLAVSLSGVGLAPAEVVIDPVSGDFGVVPVRGEALLTFTLRNSGGGTARLLDAPAVQGDGFSLSASRCGELPGSQQCFVDVSFRPVRLREDGLEDRTHNGLLIVRFEGQGPIEVPLLAISSFLLPDLSIELIAATPIGRRATDGVDFIVIRNESVMRNTGSGAAATFDVSGERLDGTWSFAPLSFDSEFSVGPVRIEGGLAAGEEIPLTTYMYVRRSLVDHAAELPVRLIVDSCAGVEFAPPECNVAEGDETNNLSAPADANPAVGESQVALDRRRSGETYNASFSETNVGDLVTDALAWFAQSTAEARGLDAPVAFLDSGTLIPPVSDGRDFIEPGVLTMVDLVDIAPWGIPVLSEATDSEAIMALFENAASQADSEAFPHIPQGSILNWCSTGPPYLRDLILQGEDIALGGDLVQPNPQVTASTKSFVDGSYGLFVGGFEPFPGSPTMSEVLRAYLGEALGGLIELGDISLGRIDDVCRVL